MDGVRVELRRHRTRSTYVYRFKVNQSGTYCITAILDSRSNWALRPIVSEPGWRAARADREHVVLLSDWTDLDPAHIYRTSSGQSNYFNFGQRHGGLFVNDVRNKAGNRPIADRAYGGPSAYGADGPRRRVRVRHTYLVNAQRRLATGRIYRARREGSLRVIKRSSMTFFDIRIPG